MGVTSDHHRRKLSSSSSNRLGEGRLGLNVNPGGGRGIAPHLVMLVAAVLIGGALGVAYQQLHEPHPNPDKGRQVKAEPAVAVATETDASVLDLVWDVKDQGVLGAGIFGGAGRSGSKKTDGGFVHGAVGGHSRELNAEKSGELGVKKLATRGLSLTEEGKNSEEVERQGTTSSGEIERTYVHQPGEMVAEDDEGGKFVVDDKDRIVYVAKEGVDHMLRGLVAKRPQGKQRERSEHI